MKQVEIRVPGTAPGGMPRLQMDDIGHIHGWGWFVALAGARPRKVCNVRKLAAQPLVRGKYFPG